MNTDATEDNFQKAIKIIEQERLMRGMVFKSYPAMARRKKKEMKYIKEFITNCYNLLKE